MTKNNVNLYDDDDPIPAGVIVDHRQGVFGVRVLLEGDPAKRSIHLMSGDDGGWWDIHSGYDPYWLDAMIEVLQEAKKALAEGTGIPAGRSLK